MPDMTLELELHKQGYAAVCGVDEAGRGPLSGPVFAAAVILPDGVEIEGLNDSKKLTEKKRELLFPIICEKALAYGIASASPEEIDSMNMEALAVKADFALIDGNASKGFAIPTMTVVKGDSRSCSIAAASILAKVSRDRLCMEHDRQYPLYGFAAHKGYGTKAHMDAIRTHGPCPIHRRSFLKFLDQ